MSFFQCLGNILSWNATWECNMCTVIQKGSGSHFMQLQLILHKEKWILEIQKLHILLAECFYYWNIRHFHILTVYSTCQLIFVEASLWYQICFRLWTCIELSMFTITQKQLFVMTKCLNANYNIKNWLLWLIQYKPFTYLCARAHTHTCITLSLAWYKTHT